VPRVNPANRQRLRLWLVAPGVAVLTAAAVAYAAGATLHEFVPPDPREDVTLGTTTPVGDLPAAIETPSGVVSAPDPFKLPTSSEKAYGRTSAPENNLFYPDRDTRRVSEVDYDDPFSPSLTPFKRLTAFDAVGADYTFRVADMTLKRVPVGGSAQLGEDPFYGDLTVDLVAGEPVRIPTVGPGTRVLKLHTVPQVTVEVLRDSADNFFLRGAQRARVRVLMHLAAPRASLGGPLRDSLWGDIPAPPPLAPRTQAAAEEVSRSIGVSRVQSFREVVDRLVTYYRSFAATDEPLPSRGDIFVDIATSKKGICRHRAFAFVVSALSLRIPARLVTNEAHAWVEVHDGLLWHRIDLGGAAMNFNDKTSEDRVAHAPPADPFGWPAGSEPGQETADRTRRKTETARDGGASPQGSSSAAPGGSAGSKPPGAPQSDPRGPSGSDPSALSAAEDPRPASTIVVTSVDREVFRNQAVHLEGKVDSPGGVCAYVRVDVELVDQAHEGQELPLGALATDGEGQFQGAVVVPSSASIGDYELVLTTPGDARCGKGRSREGQ
jgi:hypothetical protein